MKRILSLTLCLVLVGLVASSVLARPTDKDTRVNFAKLEAPQPAAFSGARQLDTLWLFADPDDPDYAGGAWGDPGTDVRGYTFDNGEGGFTFAGWTSVDETDQLVVTGNDGADNTHFHLDDAQMNLFHGTEPVINIPQNDAGPNNFAIWCGKQDVCGWSNPTGYGTNWNQYFRAAIGPGPYTINYDYWYVGDFEGATYDYSQFGTYDVDGNFVEIVLNNVEAEQTLLNYTGTANNCYGYMVWRFTSDGGWSDEDGSFISDIGAVWLDQITLTGGATQYIDVDFENGAVPGTMGGYVEAGAGMHAALYADLYQEDICLVNNTYAWAWTDCETNPPDFPEFPVCGTPAEPCPEDGGTSWMDNVLESPPLKLKHALGNPSGETFVLGAEDNIHMFWWVYIDNPLEALILTHWYCAAYTVGGACRGRFTNDNYVYYGSDKVWIQTGANSAIGPFSVITSYLLTSAQGQPIDGVKVKVGVLDYASAWCGINGDGDNQSAAPYIDNVRVALTTSSAVQWGVDDLIALAQDNFPEVGGKVRFDAPYDTDPNGVSDAVEIGDSLVVQMVIPPAAGGIGTDSSNPTGEDRPALYMYYRIVEGPHAGMVSSSSGDPMNDPDMNDGWSPYMGTETIAGPNGNETWMYCIADSARQNGNAQENKFCFDLSDTYFEAGDIIHYFYQVTTGGAYTETFPEYARSTDEFLRAVFAMDCLPSGVELLLVDDALGTSTWWDEGLVYNGYTMYDTYDVLAPSSGLENGLAGRATATDLDGYTCMIWDSDNLESFTLTNGDFDGNDKTDDTTLLGTWLSSTGHETYLWLMGCEIPNDLTAAEGFVSQEMGANLLAQNTYYDDNSGILVPQLTTTDSRLDYQTNVAGRFQLDGGCPSIENFALVAPTGNFSSEIIEFDVAHPVYPTAVAGIYQDDPDGNENPNTPQLNGVVFMPFAYRMAWEKPGPWTTNGESYTKLLVGRVLQNFFNKLPNEDQNDAPDVPAFTKLEGNYPNPFNPKTAISFALAADELVNLSVYDISGRLVKELVNGKMDAGDHEIYWDGSDASGARSASGVYFYKLNAGSYSATEKMVMLK